MEIKKELSDISWLVDEPTYRADPALSYSTISRFESLGFGGIDHINDKLDTPFLTFGQCVDTIITDGQEAFNKSFFVSEYPECPDSIIQIVKVLFKEFSETHNNLCDIPNEEIIGFASRFNYQNNWKPETRAKNIKEKGSRYYKLLYLAKDKTIINTKEYQDVVNSVEALKNSKATEFYFTPNNPFESIRRYYQLKFKATIDKVPYRIMADEIIVDYENKTIQPIDLKTSSFYEWEFPTAFVKFHYQLQARLYWKVIKLNIEKDPYFKDFKLKDYKFIVVNKNTLNPLVWDCPFTQCSTNITFGKDNQIVFRPPWEIGKELYYYLSSRPKVPIGIKKENNLVEWLNKM